LLSRAIERSPLSQRTVDDLFAAYRDPARGGATVLVAQDGAVLVNAAYGVPVQRRFTPETASPNVPLLDLSAVLNAALLPDSTGRFGAAAVRRVLAVGGMQRATFDSATRRWNASVDDLYRFELGRTALRPGARDTTTDVRGFTTETANGVRRQVAYATPQGRRAAWVRLPDQRAVIIILTNDDGFDARAAADRIADRLLGR
jgi:hypothetical protein